MTGRGDGIEYMLDANMVIYILKGLSRPVIDRLAMCKPGTVAISSLCYAKFMIGRRIQSEDEQAVLDRFFEQVPVVGFERPAADVFAALQYRQGGLNRMIGAHAFSLGATLVTNSERDYAEVRGLKTANWTL